MHSTSVGASVEGGPLAELTISTGGAPAIGRDRGANRSKRTFGQAWGHCLRAARRPGATAANRKRDRAAGEARRAASWFIRVLPAPVRGMWQG
jgi:hypothetical protein